VRYAFAPYIIPPAIQTNEDIKLTTLFESQPFTWYGELKTHVFNYDFKAAPGLYYRLDCQSLVQPQVLTDSRRRIIFFPPVDPLANYHPIAPQVITDYIWDAIEVTRTGAPSVAGHEAQFVSPPSSQTRIGIGAVEFEWTEASAVRESSKPQFISGLLLGIAITFGFQFLLYLSALFEHIWSFYRSGRDWS
jgi:hypothetical protein